MWQRIQEKTHRAHPGGRHRLSTSGSQPLLLSGGETDYSPHSGRRKGAHPSLAPSEVWREKVIEFEKAHRASGRRPEL